MLGRVALSSVFALLLTSSLFAADLPGGPARFEGELVDLAQRSRERTVLIFGLIGLGSGAVVDHQGTIVTNAHVVAGARYAIVQWADGRSVLAKRLGIDYGADLAVLRPVDPLKEPVPAFALAPSKPKPGDWVLGAGFPGGLRTTSAPTISLGRVMTIGGGQKSPVGMLDYGQAIRSDLPIFSGNSGGPMIDRQGRLVGINGAVDLERAISLTIPIEVVKQRLASLKGGVIVLPGNQRLNPARNPLLRGFFRATDALSRQIPQRVAAGSRQAARVGQRAAERAAKILPERQAPNTLAAVARKLPRQSLLDSAYRGAHYGFRSAEGVHLTGITGRYAVCKASLLRGKTRLTGVHRGHADVVAVSPLDDLALLDLSKPLRTNPPAAPHRPVGSLAYALGAGGVVASGIVSVLARPTSASVLASIQGGGSPMDPILGLLENLAKVVRVKAIQDLIEQIKKSGEAKNLFAAGTTPRSYREVLSIDAPVEPAQLGAPICDRDGSLIGVSVGIAHHGTTYVVPVTRVRAAFPEQLGAPLQPPETVRGAKLY